jgi:FlaA1/EpsC-like NDP-sugar epimerase
MGDQIKVVDMARNLIRLSGMIPEDDIPIVFTGLRPGEKLYEELVGQGETADASIIQEILKIRQTHPVDVIHLRRRVRQLEEAAIRGDEEKVFTFLKDVLPNFNSDRVPVPKSNSPVGVRARRDKLKTLDHKTA